jgi:hypothetical protein
VLGPLVVSKNRGIELRLSTGGSIDIWSIETSTIIARGRKYARALLDEIAFTAATTDMGMLWRASISPTLIDLDGSVVVALGDGSCELVLHDLQRQDARLA